MKRKRLKIITLIVTAVTCFIITNYHLGIYFQKNVVNGATFEYYPSLVVQALIVNVCIALLSFLIGALAAIAVEPAAKAVKKFKSFLNHQMHLKQ